MSSNMIMHRQGSNAEVDPFKQYETYEARPPRPVGARPYDPSSAANVHNYDSGNHATTRGFTTSAPMGDYNYHTGNTDAGQSRQNLLMNQHSDNPYSSGYRDYSTQSNSTPQTGSAAVGSAGAQPARYDEKVPSSKKPSKKWLWALIAAIVLICVILAAVLGGVLGSRAANDDDNKVDSTVPRSQTGNSRADTKVAGVFPDNVFSAASNAAKQGKSDPLAYKGTDTYGNPLFSGDANTDPPSLGDRAGECGKDPWKPTNNLDNGRKDHPRLIAPKFMWDCLGSRIQNDAYLTVWNYTIFENATKWLDEEPVKYDVDGGLSLSGILDVARIVQQRLKAWAYAWRMTHDNKYKDRAYKEMQVAAGNTSQKFGDGDKRWNPDHFLDTAEMAAGYAFAYDWMFDAWDDGQKANIRDWIVRYGLAQGLDMYNQNTAWWSNEDSGNGNWNCVCNGGLVFSALAIQNEVEGSDKDTTNQILHKALDNAKSNCMRAVYKDGTWSETPNYWYFGTNAHARMVSALMSATGSDQGLMDQNKNWYKTSEFHMYVTGNAGMFAYGDNGPNKFSTTANQLFLYSQLSQNPTYALFQRDRADAASDPLSMFWYDSSPRGAFFNGLPLDRMFDNDQGSWMSMRSSWTDMTGNYVAMKFSNHTGHQTHGDLDAGDFVIDALGTRFAGEYGSDNYLAKDYFASEDDNAARWTYFRKSSQGQNTIIIGKENLKADCKPTFNFDSSSTKQNGDLNFTPDGKSTAFVVADLSSCYGLDKDSVKRGIRFLNGRRQVLVQDEIKKQNKEVQWRVQTNATVELSNDKKTATLTIDQVKDPNAPIDKMYVKIPKVQMKATILGPDNAQFAVGPAYDKKSKKPNYYYGEDKVPKQDNDVQGNTIEAEVYDPEVSILSITLPGDADSNIQVWWQPQYEELNDADKASPKQVGLSEWSLGSH